MYKRTAEETWRQAPANDDDDEYGGVGGGVGSKEPVSRNTVGNGPSTRAGSGSANGPKRRRGRFTLYFIYMSPNRIRSATKRYYYYSYVRRRGWVALSHADLLRYTSPRRLWGALCIIYMTYAYTCACADEYILYTHNITSI